MKIIPLSKTPHVGFRFKQKDQEDQFIFKITGTRNDQYLINSYWLIENDGLITPITMPINSIIDGLKTGKYYRV